MKQIYITLFTLLFGLSAIAQIQSLSLEHGGLTRTYKFRLPAGYQESGQYPLVIVLHGLGGSGSDMINDPGLWAVMDNPQHPFIVVAPDATLDQTVFGTYEWNEGLNPFHAVDDVDFISDLIDELIANHAISPERVYCTGMSDGGFMTNRLACELNNKIAAFASVTGTMATSINCTPGRPIALFHIHGTADDVVDYNGEMLLGSPSLAPFMVSVPALMEHWTGNSNCYMDITTEMLGDDTEVFKYSQCDEGVEVWHYKVTGGAHEWYLSPSFNTTQHIWDFFEQFTLIVNVQENADFTEFEVFPNPSNGEFSVSTSFYSGFQWQIVNATGTLVDEGFSNSNNLNYGNDRLHAGVYVLRIIPSRGISLSKRIIIQ